jgi:mannose-6-phosphate isomerase-like protein (cupin superfamily)
MDKYAALAVGVVLLVGASLGAQTPAAPANQTAVVTGNHDTPLNPVAGAGNVGVSNAVLRNQPDVRVLRVVVQPGGTRIVHAHTDVRFHLFIPISGPMQLDLEGQPSVTVAPWHPYYMQKGTRHGFHNPGSSPVEIMEVFLP